MKRKVKLPRKRCIGYTLATINLSQVAETLAASGIQNTFIVEKVFLAKLRRKGR